MAPVTILVGATDVCVNGTPVALAAELRSRLGEPSIAADAARLAAATGLPDPDATSDAEPPVAPPIADFGHRLYEALLPTEEARKAVGDGNCLALDLPLDMAGLPWELMHDGRDFLALTRGTIRVIQSKAVIPEEPNSGLLAALAAPVLSGPIDVREHAAMLHRVAASCPVPITIRRHVTREVLRTTLAAVTPGIAFIVAHGSQKCIALEKEDWTSDHVSARDLARWLTRRGVWMAILNSCLTGAETDHVQAFAADLVMAGVPITVGMQYPVALTAARAFSEAFLCRVAEGADVADILTDGREAARDSEELGVEPWDFATPVLFVSSALVGPGAVRLPKLAGASGDEPHDPDGVAVQDLPRPPDRFVGRRTELRDIGEALARRSLTVIYGAHGVGKTALAREAAGRAAKQFTRVAWVSGQVRQVDEELETIRTGGMLAGRPASETDVITRLADQLGSEGLAPELNLDHRLRECLRRASRGQPLIVLDNLDSVLEGPYARQLLKELPANCGVLVTCHRRPAGTYPTVQVLDLPVADASRLVCAQARSLSLSLSQSERGLLLSKVGGHPLAARLVLARAARSDKALHRILAELPEERGQLVCYVLGELERLEHPTAVRLLTTASVFVGAVPTSVLQQASGLPPRDFREAMGVLVDLGLVERTAKAVRVGQLVGGAILRRVDVTGLEQLCAGVSWVCRIADPAILLGTTARLVDMCESRGTTRRLVALAEEALDRVTRTQDTALLGIALEVLGAALWSTQEAHGALKQYAQAQSLYVACGDLRGQAVSAVNMATLHREVGVLDEALRCCENARRLAAQIGDADLMQAAMSCLGSTLSEKGDMDRAAGCYAEALRIAGELGDAKGQAIALQNTGNMHVHGGRLSEALTCYHDARTRMAELRDTVGEAHVMGLIAIVELTRGNLDEALDYALRAHRTAEQVGDAIGGAAALGTIGIVHTERGDLAEALECLTRALEMTQVLGHPVSTALLLGSLGNVHARSGDLEQALHCFAQAHDMAKTVGSLQTMANQLGNMATVHMRRGHFAEGLRCNMEAYELGQRIGNPYTVAICLGNSGIAHLQCSDADTARRDFTRALELFDSHGFAGVRRDTVARALHELDELQRFLDRQPADAET